MIRAGAMTAGAILLGAIGVACGGTSLPEAPPCVAPTPTPSAASTYAQRIAYYRAAETGTGHLDTLLSEFRRHYPGGRFYRSAEFRQDWVRYSGAASCVARDLVSLDVPRESQESLIALEAEFEGILGDYQRILDQGNEAVRQRNTSGYRKFNDDVDAAAFRLADWLNRSVRELDD